MDGKSREGGEREPVALVRMNEHIAGRGALLPDFSVIRRSVRCFGKNILLAGKLIDGAIEVYMTEFDRPIQERDIFGIVVGRAPVLYENGQDVADREFLVGWKDRLDGQVLDCLVPFGDQTWSGPLRIDAKRQDCQTG